jgi:hypothetical protein
MKPNGRGNPIRLVAVSLIMLFTRTDKTFRDMLNGTRYSIAIIPASRPHIQDSGNVQRANDIALLARTNGLGVYILEGRGAPTSARELLVLVAGKEAQVNGFAKRVMQETDAAANWFLFCRPGSDLVKENVDRSRERCVFNSDGFRFPDGGDFKFAIAYTPAQFNTAWGHSFGAEVSDYLKADGCHNSSLV